MKRFGVRVYKEYFNFASAHFLIFADGAREELHGHGYRVRAKVQGGLGPGDMVVDFCKLKPIVKRFCDELDHRTLLPANNPRLEISNTDDGQLQALFTRADGGIDRFEMPARDALVLPISNTSTERLAEHLGEKILAVLREDNSGRLSSFSIEVEESGGQCGFYEVDPIEE